MAGGRGTAAGTESQPDLTPISKPAHSCRSQDRKVTCLRPVQFREKHALPAPELQTAVGDVETDRRRQQQRLTVRVPVDAFPEIALTVRSLTSSCRSITRGRRGALEHVGKISQQLWLMFVDDN